MDKSFMYSPQSLPDYEWEWHPSDSTDLQNCQARRLFIIAKKMKSFKYLGKTHHIIQYDRCQYGINDASVTCEYMTKSGVKTVELFYSCIRRILSLK